jgi:hypothetical protein
MAARPRSPARKRDAARTRPRAVRQAKPGKGGCIGQLKPFDGAQWVRFPPGKAWPAAGSESCASPGATLAARRRQRARRPRDRAPKRCRSPEPSQSPLAAAAPRHRSRQDAEVRPGSENAAYVRGLPRNLGGSHYLRSKSGQGAPAQTPGPPAGRSTPSGTKTSARAVPEREGGPKREGMGVRCRSACIVPMKQGNASRADPV